MTHTIGNITFGAIKNVRKSGDEEGLYFADIDISFEEGFPFETCFYCAKSDDYAATGKWVYKQIIDGNFEGELTQLAPHVDPMTGIPFADVVQPTVVGTQEL